MNGNGQGNGNDGSCPVMTTADGRPIARQQAMTAGPRGPLLMQDVELLEQMQHFNRERIPERVVHAKGSGAFGTFTVTHDISKHTRADLLSGIGKKTDIVMRFSTVAGERGAADAERDVRGFSIKFYTDEGNWDMVGNNTPVFFIRDPYKFANFIHTQKRDPKTNIRDMDMQWDFWSHCPESLHQVTILFSDRGRPVGFRHINGYGSHTYSFVNSEGERTWCKFHFKTDQGIKNLMDEEGDKLIGENRESSQQDLFESIEKGDFPSWTMKVQLMKQSQADEFEKKTGWNPFDLTKVWPHADYPLIEVGKVELNRNPDNYHAEIEQASFSPSAFVPGIGPSPDKMLQARLMSYADAHRHRVGNNYQQLPVNKPKCPVMHYQRDGQMATAEDFKTMTANYYPNTRDNMPKPSEQFRDPAWDLGNAIVDRFDSENDHDDFTQAGDLYRMFDDGERDRLTTRIAGVLGQARKQVQMLQLCHFFRADEDYGTRVAQKLGIDTDEMMRGAEAAHATT